MIGIFARRAIVQAVVAMTPMAGGLGIGVDVIDLRGVLPTNGAYPTRDPYKVEALVIHHTATTGQGWGTVAQFHVNARKWAGIGYHYGTSWDGKVFLLNDPETRSNQTGGYNTKTMGLAMLGSFQNKPPSEAQIEATAAFAKRVTEFYGIPHIRPHRFYKATACPGDSAIKALGGLWR